MGEWDGKVFLKPDRFRESPEAEAAEESSDHFRPRQSSCRSLELSAVGGRVLQQLTMMKLCSLQ